MLKSPYRKFHTYFFSECYYEDMVKVWIEYNKNCGNYAACHLKKKCSEINAFQVLRCISEQSNALKKELGISNKNFLYRHKNVSPYSRRFKTSFKSIKRNRFSENYTVVLPLKFLMLYLLILLPH